MKKEPYFEYNAELGLTTCIITDGDNIFIGLAQCHPDDQDMANEKTGCEIALKRALIKSLQHEKNNNLRPQLAALRHLESVCRDNRYISNYDRTYRNLRRQILQLESDLDTIKQLIDTEKQSLKTYIDEKENFYQKIRSNRLKG